MELRTSSRQAHLAHFARDHPTQTMARHAPSSIRARFSWRCALHGRTLHESSTVFHLGAPKFYRTGHGTPVLHGALAYIECRLNTAQDAGDHTIFIADVEDVVVREGEPLLYFQAKYHEIGPVSNDMGKSAASERAHSAERKQ